jgi:hypothetical protein
MFEQFERYGNNEFEKHKPNEFQNNRYDGSPDNYESKVENHFDGSDPNGDWVDRGVIDVDVRKINLSDSSVHGPEDFKKVSHEDMVNGFNKLENEVRPAVRSGADKDYFFQSDQANQLEYKDGHQRIYESFYGQDSIRLNRVGDNYEVVNGYHRLYVAKELNIQTIPARVVEKRFY